MPSYEKKRKEYKTSLSAEEASILENFMKKEGIVKTATAIRELVIEYQEMKDGGAFKLSKKEQELIHCLREKGFI